MRWRAFTSAISRWISARGILRTCSGSTGASGQFPHTPNQTKFSPCILSCMVSRRRLACIRARRILTVCDGEGTSTSRRRRGRQPSRSSPSRTSTTPRTPSVAGVSRPHFFSSRTAISFYCANALCFFLQCCLAKMIKGMSSIRVLTLSLLLCSSRPIPPRRRSAVRGQPSSLRAIT